VIAQAVRVSLVTACRRQRGREHGVPFGDHEHVGSRLQQLSGEDPWRFVPRVYVGHHHVQAWRAGHPSRLVIRSQAGYDQHEVIDAESERGSSEDPGALHDCDGKDHPRQ
jgi:hypothetical protein